MYKKKTPAYLSVNSVKKSMCFLMRGQDIALPPHGFAISSSLITMFSTYASLEGGGVQHVSKGDGEKLWVIQGDEVH